MLVNNASILGPSPQPQLLDYPLEILEQVYRVNTIAPLALVQAVRHLLLPGARILNITSDAGVEAYPGWGGYGSSKAALEQLTNILAAERPEWHVYWVDPGDMRTDLHQLAFPGEDISDRPLPEESIPGLLALLYSGLPSGRYKVRELASLAPTSESVNETEAQGDLDDRTNVRMRTQMHQEAFPGEDISDRPLPEVSAPGLVELLSGALPSGRYQARALPAATSGGPVTEGGVKETRVALTVSDFDRALAFYRDGLGLELVADWTQSATGRSAVLDAGRATIELLDEADATYTDSVEAGRRVAGPVRLALEVGDVASAAARLQAQGGEPLRDPVHTSWGNLTQRLLGPDGMNISLYQPENPGG
jgi:catechol 2,3-dioxygenase-like lactoylglutathione lyase family enzyme